MSSLTKIVLAYSGGLDTSVCIPWLRQAYGAEVVAVTVDLGQDDDLEAVAAKARGSGASDVHVADLRDVFAEKFLLPLLQAGAVYEGEYLLGTAAARPLIAQHLVKVARQTGADGIAHGATGKGNDQVRFELTIGALAPDLAVVAPWREWDIRSREDALAYAAAHGVDVPNTREDIYSRDGNLWHLSHEGGPLEDPWTDHDPALYQRTTPPADAPAEAETVTISFGEGVPVAVDGEGLSLRGVIEALNDSGGRHGVGIVDMVENRRVGLKSRGVYETPGGTVLYTAHRALERLVLDRATSHYKARVAQRYAELVYDGKWFTPLRQALDGFVTATQRYVTGDVRVRLYRGTCRAAGARSPNSLYQEALATFGEDDVYDQSLAEGFIRLFGLPVKTHAQVNGADGVDYGEGGVDHH